jgi:hypothetical protein
LILAIKDPNALEVRHSPLTFSGTTNEAARRRRKISRTKPRKFGRIDTVLLPFGERQRQTPPCVLQVVEQLMSRNVKKVLSNLNLLVGSAFQNANLKAVGGFLFLRFICPALVAPEGFDILKGNFFPFADPQNLLQRKCEGRCV